MNDPTEKIRRQMVPQVNAMQDGEIAAQEGRLWTTEEFVAEFRVLGFLAPFVHVQRKSDGKEGSMKFRHNPRVYFGFREYSS